MAPQPTDKGRAIGARIEEARKEMGGMTQRELGELIGVSERSVQAYEAGEVIPYRLIRDIERAVGRSAAWLLHGDAAIVDHNGQLNEVLERLDKIQASIDKLAKKR